MDRAYWHTVVLVTLWQVAASSCYYTVFAATPLFRDAFGLSRFTVGFVVTALTLGYAAFLLPIGALIDRHGERRTLAVGLLGLSSATVLVAGAPSVALLLVAAFVLGSLYATAIPGTNKAIYDAIAAGRQNFAMGIKQVGVTAGSGISSLLVTGLAGAFFWQAGFLVASGVGLVLRRRAVRRALSQHRRQRAGRPRTRGERRRGRFAVVSRLRGALSEPSVSRPRRCGLFPRGRAVHHDRLHRSVRLGGDRCVRPE